MATEVKIPALGDSIVEIQIGRWLKKEGDWADRDEIIVELETDKSAVELPSPVAGRVAKLLKAVGEAAKVGDVVAHIEPGSKPAASVAATAPTAAPKAAQAEMPQRVMPAAQRILAQNQIKTEQVTPTGPGQRILKEDAERAVEKAAIKPSTPPSSSTPSTAAKTTAPANSAERAETTTPMTLIRRRIADRLVQAQQNAALLTTFNEIDMSSVMALRNQYKEAFQQKFAVKLGFMSFFVKAVVDALQIVPQLNSEVRGTDIISRNFNDIGVAIGGGKGLVVPILRNAERMTFAEIESKIADLAKRASENKLSIEELTGGTFTISNGGIYGSLLSTPIVNPPQSGILGMHAIQERAVVVAGQVVVRPMMYVALTYDHRLVDGREAVTFLKRVKDVIEAPVRLLMEV